MKLKDWITLSPVFLKSFFKLPVSHSLYMAKLLSFENPHSVGGRLHINTFFPPYPSAAFDKFMSAVYTGRRVPFSAYFAVTDQCPYICPHCSYGRRSRGSLSTQQAFDIITQIKSIGTVTIGFTGGEPLMRADIAEIVDRAGGDMAKVLFTTGCNLTGSLAGSLRDAGLDAMMIGIESNDERTHDRTRGVEGSFKTAVAAIEKSLRAGIYTAISTVATAEKIDNGTIYAIAEAANRLGVSEFRILEPVPTGAIAGQTGMSLTSSQSKALADFHKKWNKKGRGVAISAFSHLESDEAFGCGAGFHHLFIDALGNVCPCDLTPLSLGCALEEPLADIWQKMNEYFSQPRCGCIMKEICSQTELGGQALPLPPKESEKLCRKLSKNAPLPQAVKRLKRF